MALLEKLLAGVVPLAIIVYGGTMLWLLPTVIKHATGAVGGIFLLNELDSVDNLIWVNWSTYSAVCDLLGGWLVWAREFKKNRGHNHLVTWSSNRFLCTLLDLFSAAEHSTSWSELLDRLLVGYEVDLLLNAAELVIILELRSDNFL